MCGTCLMVIAVQNPIHSILLLIRVFFMGTLLLFALQIEYYAILFLIVYVGAIVVLFLFIIRRLELKMINVIIQRGDLFSFRHLILGFFLVETLFRSSYDFFDLNFFINSTNIMKIINNNVFTEGNGFIDWSTILHRTDHLRALGGILYTEYKITIIVASILLFLSIVGALAVTLYFPKNYFSIEIISNRKFQDPNLQTRRHPSFIFKK